MAAYNILSLTLRHIFHAKFLYDENDIGNSAATEIDTIFISWITFGSLVKCIFRLRKVTVAKRKGVGKVKRKEIANAAEIVCGKKEGKNISKYVTYICIISAYILS